MLWFDCHYYLLLSLVIGITESFTNIISTQSPITTSPATLSPTSIPTRHPTARFPYSPVNSPGEANAVSPTHGTSQVCHIQKFFFVYWIACIVHTA